jgi:hypothetical protein
MIYDCYYCLNQNIPDNEVSEYTGGIEPCPICPRCSIDSLVPHTTMARLYAEHIKMFHFACSIKKSVSKEMEFEPEEVVTCGHQLCKEWDLLVHKITKMKR